MAEVIWTAKADTHLQEINTYLSSFSEYYAIKFLKELILHVDLLATHPSIGKVYYKGIYTYRRLLYKKYIIIYRENSDCIYINAVYHQH